MLSQTHAGQYGARPLKRCACRSGMCCRLPERNWPSQPLLRKSNFSPLGPKCVGSMEVRNVVCKSTSIHTHTRRLRRKYRYDTHLALAMYVHNTRTYKGRSHAGLDHCCHPWRRPAEKYKAVWRASLRVHRMATSRNRDERILEAQLLQ